MFLPKSKIGRKLLMFLIAASILPLCVVNFMWFSFTKNHLNDPLTVEFITVLASALFTLTILLVTLLSVWVSARIVGPIKKFQEWTRLVGAGNFTYKLTFSGKDEIEELGNAMNAMALNLQSSFKNVEESRSIAFTEKNKMQVTLSSITDAVIAVDLSRTIILFNRAAEKITGLSQKDAIGKKIDQLIQLSDDAGPLSPSAYCPIILQGVEGIVFSKQNVKLIAYGEKVGYVDVTASQIKEGLSANVGCIVALHDIKKEKELEEMKLDFVSMAAHELRTPLTSIKGYLSVLTDESAQKLNPEERTFLGRISISVDQLMGLIENLLNVSRIERGALTVNIASFDWVAFVRESVGQMLPRAREKNIDLSFVEPQEVVPNVMCDKVRITEVLSNLVANAINYTEQYGRIRVSVEKRDNEVVTSVQDTGQGIPDDAIPNLFKKFYRISGKLGQGSKGTGLGLYISRAIVEMHHGRIWVVSELGKGSTFSFSLPAEGEKSDGGEKKETTTH